MAIDLKKVMEYKAKLIHTIPWLILAFVFFAIDQTTKWWALHYLFWDQIVQPFPVVEFLLTQNRGVAFSFLSEQGTWAQIFLLAVALLISVLLIVLVSKPAERTINKWAFMLILGGAMGNAYDRMQMRGVLDFITLDMGRWHWPTVFNVADIFITGGCIILLCTFWVKRPTVEITSNE